MAFYTLNQILDIGTLHKSSYTSILIHGSIYWFDSDIEDLSRVATLFLAKANQECAVERTANHILYVMHYVYYGWDTNFQLELVQNYIFYA